MSQKLHSHARDRADILALSGSQYSLKGGPDIGTSLLTHAGLEDPAK